MKRRDIGSRASPIQKTTWLIITFIIAGFLLVPWAAQARALKATIHQIILDPTAYLGKTLEVEGIVKSLQEVCTPKGESFTIFELTAQDSVASLEVVAHKKEVCKEDDQVRVVGKYRQKNDCPSGCRRNVIDSASVTKLGSTVCK